MDSNGYDLHIQSNYSGGENTIKEILQRAHQLQLGTICIADTLSTIQEFKKREQEIKELLSPVKVLQGILIQAKNAQELRSKVDYWRDVSDIIVVAGGSVEINRAAAENPKVDVLAYPEKDRKDSGIDDVIAKAAAKNRVAIQLNFSEYLRTFKKIRAYVLSHMRRNVMLCKQYEVSVIVCSGARSIWEMRTARDLTALSYITGLDREKAVKTTTDAPDMIVKSVAERKSENFIRPGVRVIEG